MNELEKQLSKILEKALNVAEKSGEFVMEQAPLLLQEFYKWHILSYILGIFLGVLIYISGRYLPYLWLNKESTGKFSVRFFKKWNTNGDNISKDPSAAWIIFTLTTISSVSIILVKTYKLMYILVAPKLYLIEYFVK
jgi:hypothetical protein